MPVRDKLIEVKTFPFQGSGFTPPAPNKSGTYQAPIHRGNMGGVLIVRVLRRFIHKWGINFVILCSGWVPASPMTSGQWLLWSSTALKPRILLEEEVGRTPVGAENTRLGCC